MLQHGTGTCFCFVFFGCRNRHLKNAICLSMFETWPRQEMFIAVEAPKDILMEPLRKKARLAKISPLTGPLKTDVCNMGSIREKHAVNMSFQFFESWFY